jgi:hypothetical protein
MTVMVAEAGIVLEKVMFPELAGLMTTVMRYLSMFPLYFTVAVAVPSGFLTTVTF